MELVEMGVVCLGKRCRNVELITHICLISGVEFHFIKSGADIFKRILRNSI